MKDLLVLVCVFILVCGCMTPVENNQPTAGQPTNGISEQTLATEPPTPEPTFVSPRHYDYATEEPTTRPTTNQPVEVVTTKTCGATTNLATTNTPTPVWENTDTSIIGKWVLREGPYPCSAFFYSNGYGIMTCGIFPATVQKDIDWTNSGVGTYYAVIHDTPNNHATNVKIENGILTADVLPSGSYMVKL